jgi:predicted transcriptional regulator
MGNKSLGELQLAIMRVLWRAGEATAAEVHRALVDARGLAPTTIATMLRKMEAKGVVTHRADGRQFVYSASVAQTEVKRSMVGELVDRLFGGDPEALVSHLVEEGEIDSEQLEELRARVAESRRRGRSDV